MAHTSTSRTFAAQYLGGHFVDEQVIYNKETVKVTRNAIADKDLKEAQRLVSMAVNKVKDAMKNNYRDESYDENMLLEIRKQMEACVEAIDQCVG